MDSREIELSVAIIGRGLAGLTLAVELARRAVARVGIIYDENDNQAATPAAHGLSAIKGILEADSELFSKKIAGHRGFEDYLSGLEDLIGRKRPKNVWKKGVLEAFSTHENFRQQFGRIYRRDFVGAKNMRLNTEDNNEFARAFYPGDFWVDPRYLVEVLTAAAKKLGVIMIITRVEHINPCAKFTKIRLTDGRDIVSTHAVICAGAGSSRLLPQSIRNRVAPLYAVSGWTFNSEHRGPDSLEVKSACSLAARGGHLFWGSSSDPSAPADNFVRRAKPAIDKVLLAATLLKKINPSILPTAAVDGKWGVRVRTKDRSPLVQCVDGQSNIWINCGYYKSGIILSWLYARDLAAQICSKL